MIAIRLIKEITRWMVFTFYKSNAIARWKVTGKRHWVLPVGKRRMTVLCNDDIRAYNQKAKKHHYQPINIKILMEIALYGTPAGSTGERKRHG